MEVVVPVQEFLFESATTTPYMSAPSSPKHFGLDPLEFYYPYAGAHTSPAAAAAVDEDFAFDFSGHLEKNAQPPELTSADELFEQGKIRPLRPPTGLCSPNDHIAATITRGRNNNPVSGFSPSNSHYQSPKGSRSSSPLRARKGSTDHFQTPIYSHPPPIETISCSCKGGGGEGSWKWRFKDFLLFRSASEGRATGDGRKDFHRRFTALPSSYSPPKLKKEGSGDVSRSSSFRSVDSDRSVRRGSARRAVSPHARHYTANKAAAEEMKKKTALPYRQSFFSCLRFSPALHSLTSRGL